MKPDIKKRWIEALRSGKYKQVDGVLRGPIFEQDITYAGIGHCCLGVLCDLFMKDNPESGLRWAPERVIPGREAPVFEDYSLENQSGPVATELLPTDVADWAGLTTENPEVPKGSPVTVRLGLGASDLASLNDEGATFEDIAEIVETHL